VKIPFDKYKRVFAFGCSFTSCNYPTWANILANEMPDAEFYNFGASGGGNLFIAASITEANVRFKFCDTDLVMVMYSTSFREDRHVNGKWQLFGNIYNQPFYPMKTFVVPFCQPVGMLIRDLALIQMSAQYVRSLPCDNLLLKVASVLDESSKAPNFHQEDDHQVVELYRNCLDSFPPTLCETEFPNGLRKGITVMRDKKLYTDMHPLTDSYYNYLLKIGVNLTERAEQYVDDSMIKLSQCRDFEDFGKIFPEIAEQRECRNRIMF